MCMKVYICVCEWNIMSILPLKNKTELPNFPQARVEIQIQSFAEN